MSVFSRLTNYSRPGSGKDDSEYPSFILFWRRFGRHFSKLLFSNLLCFLVALPVIVWLCTILNVLAAESNEGVVSLLSTLVLSVVMDWPQELLIALVICSAILLGPTFAAVSLCALDCAWDRAGLFWYRFRIAWKENFRQALPVGIADIIICFSTVYYFVDGTAAFGEYNRFLLVLWLVLILFYAFMHVYLFPIMVTVELPLGALVKNSLILALLKAWRPLVVIAVDIALALLCLMADMIVLPCFFFSFTAYTAAFLTRPVIEKYLLQPEEEGEAENKGTMGG